MLLANVWHQSHIHSAQSCLPEMVLSHQGLKIMALPKWYLLLDQAHLQHIPKDVSVKVFILALVSDGICAECACPIYECLSFLFPPELSIQSFIRSSLLSEN